MSKFSDMNFTEKEKVAVDFSKLKERGPRSAPPQPGHGYVFQLPKISLDDDNWGEIETDAGRRISYSFRNGAELTLVSSPLNPLENGTLHGWQLSNEERKFNPDEDAFSKMAFLLKAFGLDLTDASIPAYAKALTAIGGKRFTASITWTARCSPDRDIYRVDAETGIGEVLEGVKGCAQRYGLKAKKNNKTGEVTVLFPRDPETGLYATRFQCIEPCEASISPFIDLYNFRPAPVETGNGGADARAEGSALSSGKQQPAAKV